ncbi:MAG TPA: hypothetical protein VGI43_15860 [Mucilaginibacter sp.]|jgi:hypothetical protein
MKTIKLLPLFVLILCIIACTKNGNNPSNVGAVSTDDAADMVGSSLASNYNGLATVSDDVTNAGTSLTASSIASIHGSTFNSLNANPNTVAGIDKKQLACGLMIADTVSRQGGSSVVNYSYNSIYNFTLNCNNNVPNDMTSLLAYNGNFSGPVWLLTDTGTTNFTVTGLSPQATDFVLNGEYKRHGSFSSKIDTTKHGYRSVDIVVTALTLLKPARTIVSGTATIAVSGYTRKRGNFTYNGTLVFNNDGTANLTLNGTAYNINLTTGIKLKKN